jgi:hydrogenase/urease accessory protein HupE
MRFWRRVLLAAILFGPGVPVWAHQVNLSTARLALARDRTVAVEVALKGSEVDRMVGTRVYDAKEDAVDAAAVAASATPILAYLTTHLAVTGVEGAVCRPGDAAITADGDAVIFRNTFSCGHIAGEIVYHSTVLTEKDPTARQIVLIAQGNNSEAQALLDTDNTTVTLFGPPPSLSSVMRRYVVTGIEHIFVGYDHLAFLIAVVLWARRLVPVIKIVTAFTIAHSITLSLAALDVLVIPSRIVEPAIAVSIVFVALENFFSRDIDRRWRVTFAFGLIHGFGFAGALREVGLPLNATISALAGFNVGVEIGQVAIVAIAVPALLVLDRAIASDHGKPVRAAPVVYALSGAIGLLGSYWFVTRVLEA